jgi:hypothetical protein
VNTTTITVEEFVIEDFEKFKAELQAEIKASEFSKNPDQIAEMHGLEIVEPGPNELQIDIDSPEIPAKFHEQLSILGQFYGETTYRTTRSKSGNVHIYVTMNNEVGDLERIMLQALLGSDIKRELLTLKNYKEGKERHQFLYETKAKQLTAGE